MLLSRWPSGGNRLERKRCGGVTSMPNAGYVHRNYRCASRSPATRSTTKRVVAPRQSVSPWKSSFGG